MSNPTCPNCGDELTALDSPDAPPWVCRPDGRAWWPSEVTDEAREAWDPIQRSFVGPKAMTILLNSYVDRDNAREVRAARPVKKATKARKVGTKKGQPRQPTNPKKKAK